MNQVITDTKVPIKIWTDEIEDTALIQMRNVANLPFIFKHLSIMPDVHAGWGATIGSVIATKGAVIPSAVGVDIGCGMMAHCLGFGRDVLVEKDIRVLSCPKSRSRTAKVGSAFNLSILKL